MTPNKCFGIIFSNYNIIITVQTESFYTFDSRFGRWKYGFLQIQLDVLFVAKINNLLPHGVPSIVCVRVCVRVCVCVLVYNSIHVIVVVLEEANKQFTNCLYTDWLICDVITNISDVSCCYLMSALISAYGVANWTSCLQLT